MNTPYDMDRIVGGLEVIKHIDPPCEVELKDGEIWAGPDMSPDSLYPEQAEKLLALGWEYIQHRGAIVGCWRLKLE